MDTIDNQIRENLKDIFLKFLLDLGTLLLQVK